MGLFPKDRDLTQAPRDVELRVDASFFRARAEHLEMRLDAILSAQLTLAQHEVTDPTLPRPRFPCARTLDFPRAGRWIES
jgi:hypothetical protein